MSGQQPLGVQFAFAFRALADRHADLLSARVDGGLKPSHAYVLRSVAEEPQSVRQIAELLQVSKQAASQIVDQLEERGLLRRSVSAADRRSREVAPTVAGRDLLATAEAAWRVVEEEFAEVVGAEAYADLRATLSAFLASQPEGRRVRPVW